MQQSALRPTSPPSHARAVLAILGAMLAGCFATLPWGHTQEPPAASEDRLPPLYEQEPFDLLILDEANKNAQLRVLPLPFPDRKLPANRSGSLTIRLVGDDPSDYEVSWKSIRNVKLYEELLLEEANRLIGENQLDAAYEYLDHLRAIRPNWPGLNEALERYLLADARFLAGKDQQRFAESLAVLEELYARNPSFRASPTKSVMDVMSDLFDRVVNNYFEKKDYRSARQLLKRMADKYQAKRPPSTDRWVAHLQSLATEKRDAAQKLLAEKQFRPALGALKETRDIWPNLPGAAELEAELAATYPLVMVGVTQPAAVQDSQRLDDWAARRTGRLVQRSLMEFLGAGPEGGQYLFPWGTVEHSEDRRRLIIRVNRNAANATPPVTGFTIARRGLQLAAPEHPEYNPAWASLLQAARVDQVTTVEFDLRRPHVLPEAWLTVPLAPLAAGESGDGEFHLQAQTAAESQFVHRGFQPGGRLAEVVEQTFPDSQAALTALRRGDIDLVDRLFPADALRLAANTREAEIKVAPYAHPTVHILVPNTKNPFLENRDFRRALVVAIDRKRVLAEEILGGKEQLGCRVLSGPFPASASEADPLGYAYDETIEPWPHNALFAKVLSLAAMKQVEQLAKTRGNPQPKLTRFVLGHPGSEIARLGSQAIQAYWKVIGIEVELREFPPGISRDEKGECDLVYKEVAIWEPVVDARRLLGPKGVAPTDSPYVAQSLRWLEEAENWSDVRDRLQDIHRANYHDAAILPLWQVVDYYAYHRRVRNLGERLVWLYQNVGQWRIGGEAAGR